MMGSVRSDSPIAPAAPPVVKAAGGWGKPRRRFQLGLGDVAVWVIGAAIISVMVRRWLARWWGPAPGGAPSDSPWPSLASFILLVVLGVHLAGQMVRLALGRVELIMPEVGAVGPFRGAAIAWRGVALSLLVALTMELAGSVSDPLSSVYTSISVKPRNLPWDDGLPLYGVLVILGLLVGMRPPAARTRGRVRWVGLSTSLAGLLAVALVTGFMLIPYLVLVAIEAVANAQQVFALQDLGIADVQVVVPLAAWPDAPGRQAASRLPLDLRISQAALPAAIALATTLATGAWISRDLRQAARVADHRPLSRRSILYRLATFTAMVTAATHLLGTTIPRIHEWVLPSVGSFLGPRELATLVAGFAVLSAGVVARAIGRSDEVADRLPVSRSRGRLKHLAAGLVLLWLALGCVERILIQLGYPPEFLVPTSLIGGVLADLLTWVPGHWDQLWSFPIPVMFGFPALLWASIETLRRCGTQAPDRATAFDAVFVARRRTRRFLWLWAALTTLCLCALPTLFVAGLVVYRFRLMRLG